LNKNKLIASIWIASIIATVLVLQAFSSSPINDASYYPATQIETASYVVFRDGSTYYAKDGNSGEIPYSGSNWNTVMQSCTDAIGTTGGLIFLKVGTYNQNKDEFITLSANYKLIIEGENPLTTKIVKAGGGNPSSDYIIRGTTTSTNPPTLTLRNLYFDCTSYEGDSAVGQYFTQVTAQNLHAYGLGTTSNNEVFLGCVKGNLVVENCHIEDFAYSTWCYYYDYVYISNNYIENCGTVGLGSGKYPNENATIQIIGNTLVDCGWEDEGLVIDAGWDNPVSRVNGLIANNIIINPTKSNKNGDIAVIAVSNVVIENNFIYDVGTPQDTSRTCGIKTSGSVTYPIYNITIRNNEIWSSNRGIFVKNTFDSLVYGNKITMENEAQLRGIYLICDNGCPLSGENYAIDNTIYIRSGGVTTSHGISVQLNGTGTTNVHLYRNIINVLSGTTKKGIYLSLITSTVTAYLKDNRIIADQLVAPDQPDQTVFLNTFTIPFVEGTYPPIRLEPLGFYLNETNAVAFTYCVLPEDVQQLMIIRIYAVSNVDETDSMTLDVAINGGYEKEAYNTVSYVSTTHNSTTTDFSQYDIIYWDCYFFPGSLKVGGLSMSIRMKYEAGSGDNCATDAWFTCAQILYV